MISKNLYSIMIIIIMMTFIVFMAYFATVFISKKTNIYFQDKSVKILERLVLANNLSVVAVQIIDQVYILAMNSKNIELLDIIEYEKWDHFKKTRNKPSQKNLLDIFKSSFLNRIIKNENPNIYSNQNCNHKKGD